MTRVLRFFKMNATLAAADPCAKETSKLSRGGGDDGNNRPSKEGLMVGGRKKLEKQINTGQTKI